MQIIIDGNNFNTLEGFYKEVDNKFTKNLDWETGHNLNAFNDILKGGFGVHEYGEAITIRWKNFSRSQNELSKDLMDDIVKIIKDTDNSGHNCTLEIE